MQNLTEICQGKDQELFYLNGQVPITYCTLQGRQDCKYQLKQKMKIPYYNGKKRHHLCNLDYDLEEKLD